MVARLVTGSPVDLTGYIRFPERAGWLTPAANVAKRLWFVRDHLDMARTLGWGEVAPFYIDLERPAPLSGIPKPGPLQVHLKDDHLQYAITWFALAGAVVIAFVVWWRGRRTRPVKGQWLAATRPAGPSGQLPVLAADDRQLFGLNRFEPRHHQDAGHKRQSEVFSLFDGVVNFFDQYSRFGFAT